MRLSGLRSQLPYFIFASLILLPFQNCAPPSHISLDTLSQQSSSLPGGLTLDVDPALQSQALVILSSKCGACHQAMTSGGVGQILDVNHLLIVGLITAGDPTKGRLMGAINDGSMPKGLSISAGEVQVLSDWIRSMSIIGGTLPPIASPLPSGKTVQVDSGLHLQAMQIINVNCAGCHQAITSGGITDILNIKNLVASGLVTAGDATKGRLIASILESSMPKGTGARVSSADLLTLRNWINSMSIVDDVGQAPAPTRPDLSPTFTGVFANIIQPKCLACHGPIKQEDKRFDSYDLVKANTGNILSECRSHNMPEAPYPVLTSAELAALTAWIGDGAPNN